MEGFYFISYSKVDSTDLARKLANDLQRIPPSIPVWLEERECQGGIDWDEQLVEALRTCSGVLFLMTADSVHPRSECKREWTRALRYKKPIIPLLVEPNVEMPLDSILIFRATMTRHWQHCVAIYNGACRLKGYYLVFKNVSTMLNGTCPGHQMKRNRPEFKMRWTRLGKRLLRSRRR